MSKCSFVKSFSGVTKPRKSLMSLLKSLLDGADDGMKRSIVNKHHLIGLNFFPPFTLLRTPVVSKALSVHS